MLLCAYFILYNVGNFILQALTLCILYRLVQIIWVEIRTFLPTEPYDTYKAKHYIWWSCTSMCSAGKCRIAGKRHNLRKMSHRRREMSQSAENVGNTTAGICRIVDGKCRKKVRCRYMSQHRREMSQLLLILHIDNLLKRKQQVIKFTCIWIAYIKLITCYYSIYM